MRILRTHEIALLSTLILTSTIFPSPAPAVTFDQQEIEQSQSIAIARPFGQGQYDLLILQQIPGQRQCWSESGSNPTTVQPLLLDFDFTGICDRSTDSNGYSIRLDGQDYGLDYLLRIAKRKGELVLVGTHRTNGTKPEIVVGHTNGMASGFLKIYLEPGWRFTQRLYQGKVLSHIYLTRDSSAIGPSENREPTVANDIQADSTGKIKEITITAGEAQPSVVTTEPENQQTSAATPPALPTSLPPPLPKRLPTTSSSKTLPPLPSPRASQTTLPPALSPKTLPPPLPSPRASQTPLPPALSPKTLPPPLPSPRASQTTLPPALSPKNPPSLPSFSQLPPLPPPSPVANAQVVPPPLPKSATASNRKTLSDVLVVSPGQAPTSNPYRANAPAGNLETASRQESYRVMVQADNPSQQNQLRSLYPEAFSTRYGGQSLWQIGVFSSRNNADSALQSVESLGLQGKIIQY